MSKQSNNIIVLIVIGVLFATLKSKAGILYASALNFIKIKILKEFPKIRILTGTKDPLYDD